MVGGDPLGHEFTQNIGADVFGKDAADAVAITKNLITSQLGSFEIGSE